MENQFETAPIRRQNPKWVGLIMAILLPGSAHFLAGQRRTGICWFFTLFLLTFLAIVLLCVPGLGFFYAAVFFLAVQILCHIYVLISSWRHTPRIGCLGWLALILIGNYGLGDYSLQSRDSRFV
jgi:hypothetical protein